MNNLKDLSEELIKDIHRLEGFSSPLIEEELISNLSKKLESELETKEDRIKALRNMFALGQIFALGQVNNH
jgi:hypothetical protein